MESQSRRPFPYQPVAWSVRRMSFDMAAQIEQWRKQLLDTSKRNRLVNFRTGRTGGIALVHPGPGDIWHRLMAGGSPLTFPWKRELIDLPLEVEDESET